MRYAKKTPFSKSSVVDDCRREAKKNSKEFSDRLALGDDFDRPPAPADVFVLRVDLEGLAVGLKEIWNGDWAIDDFTALFVDSADHLATSDAAPGQSGTKCAWKVIPPTTRIDSRCASELAHPDDECRIEHSSLLQIGDQLRHRLINLRGELRCFAEIVLVGIPASTIDLDEGYPRFDETTGQETPGGKLRFPIRCADCFRFQH